MKRHIAAFARGLVAYGLSPLLALLTAPLLAQVLGPTGRGQLAAVMQPLTVADAIAAFGVPSAITYFVARGGNAHSVQRMGRRVVLLSAGTIYILMLLYSGPVSRAQGVPLLILDIVWAATITGTFLAVRRAAWAGLRNWRRLDAERMLSAMARTALILLLLALGITSIGALALIPVVGLTVVSSMMLYGKRIPHTHDAASPTPRDFFSYAASASFGTITWVLSSRLDQFLLPVSVSSQDLGYYVVAVTVAEIPLIVGSLAARNLLAEVASGASRETLMRTLGLTVATTLLACTCIITLSPWAIPIVFGTAFTSSVAVCQILTAATFFTVCSMSIAAISNGRNRPLLVGYANLAPIASIGLYILINAQAVSITGVATAVLIGQIVGLIMLIGLMAISERRQRP